MKDIALDPSQAASMPDMRAALLFWVDKDSREAAPHFGATDSDCTANAMLILEYTSDYKQEWLAGLVRRNEDLHYGVATALLQSALRSLSGTSASIAMHGQRKNKNISMEESLQALEMASRAEMFLPSSNSDPDVLRARLNLWLKRCRFLSSRLRQESIENKKTVVASSGWTEERAGKALGSWDAHECVEEIKRLVHSYGDSDPSIVSFLFSAFAVIGNPASAIQEINLLEQTHPDFILHANSTVVYNSILNAFITKGRSNKTSKTFIDNLSEAIEFWERLKCSDVVLDLHSYATMMNILAHYGRLGEAEQLLDEMEDTIHRKPETIHFNICLNGWATKSRSDPTDHSLQRAESMLRSMPSRGAQPDQISYTAVIGACFSSMNPQGMRKAERLLELMEKDPNVEVDEDVFVSVISGLYHSLSVVNDNGAKTYFAEQIEALFRYSSLPSVNGLNLCLQAWSRSYSDQAGQRSIDLFHDYCLASATVIPNSYSCLHFMKALASKSLPDPLPKAKELLEYMRVNQIPQHKGVLNQYIRLLARCGSIEEAEAFLQEMISNCKKGLPSYCPQENTYRYILEEYFRYPERIHNAEALYASLKENASRNPELSPRVATVAVSHF